MADPPVRQEIPAKEIEEHLRSASDAILLLLKEVGQLEQQKRRIPPGEPRFDEVAREVRAASAALAEFTHRQEDWARAATADRIDLETIEESESPPHLADLLERWRAVERALDDAPAGSPEAARLFAEFEALRHQYMSAFRALTDEPPHEE